MKTVGWIFTDVAALALGGLIGAGIALFALIVVKRLTDGLTEDIRKEGLKGSILVNRTLFDRSHI